MTKNTLPQEINNKPSLRLNKALASAGVCSRRAADELIAAGKVLVNNLPASPGQQVIPHLDQITVNGTPVLFDDEGEAHTYILLHKPIQVVCTAKDPQGRETVLDILPSQWRSTRIYPVGRLDYFSEGLLLLTDDGELTFRLTHPGWHMPRVYEVKVRGEVTEAKLARMRAGMTLQEGETLAPIEVEIKLREGREGEDTILLLTLHQGINRQIRRMCRDLDLTILYLRRIKMGPLNLGSLGKGLARILSEEEVAELLQAVGLGKNRG